MEPIVPAKVSVEKEQRTNRYLNSNKRVFVTWKFTQRSHRFVSLLHQLERIVDNAHRLALTYEIDILKTQIFNFNTICLGSQQSLNLIAYSSQIQSIYILLKESRK